MRVLLAPPVHVDPRAPPHPLLLVAHNLRWSRAPARLGVRLSTLPSHRLELTGLRERNLHTLLNYFVGLTIRRDAIRTVRFLAKLPSCKCSAQLTKILHATGDK